MSFISVARCDGNCGDEVAASRSNDLPAGWLKVNVTEATIGLPNNMYLSFCSFSCLNKWSAAICLQREEAEKVQHVQKDPSPGFNLKARFDLKEPQP